MEASDLKLSPYDNDFRPSNVYLEERHEHQKTDQHPVIKTYFNMKSKKTI
ncbi:MAG: hypothetical protein KAV40_03060 [Thermoplasmatales archaeon]|nr:hypothetical protein [Thermoplasmatales archaeon]